MQSKKEILVRLIKTPSTVDHMMCADACVSICPTTATIDPHGVPPADAHIQARHWRLPQQPSHIL